MKLDVSNLSFSYGEKSILKDLHFSVSDGTFCSLIGSNGVGKSTLLKCILGIYRDYQGQVSIDGEDIRFHKPRELARKMAYIPQSHIPAFHYSVLDMVHAFEKTTGQKIKYKITERRAGDIATCYADATKAKEELNWVAEKTLEDMCRDSWNYIKISH